jgi:hypothetical protein
VCAKLKSIAGNHAKNAGFCANIGVGRGSGSRTEGEKPGMPARLLNRIIEKLCPHRFSWPHSGANGQDYQVCLICGSAYEYDLIEMRRTGRMVDPAELQGNRASHKSTGV